MTTPDASAPGLPAAFVQRVHAIVPPAHADAAIRSFGIDKPVTFRVNLHAGGSSDAGPAGDDAEVIGVADTVASLRADGLTPRALPWCPTAYEVPAAQREALTHHPEAERGGVYVQGRSSLLAALVLAPEPGEEVLDLAAAPCGNTLHLAALMHGRGRIGAVEPVKDRFYRLKANVERAGADIVHLYQRDGREVGRRAAGRFDRVLLDAPCSGESRFDPARPQTFQFWSTAKLDAMARKQRALLRSALDAARLGGVVLYATCSLAPEENEAVVSHALRRLGEAVTLETIALPAGCEARVQPGLTAWNGRAFDPRCERCVRVLPDERFDAFFFALLRRV